MDAYTWLIWLIAAVFFGVLEAATVSLVSLWFVGGSLAAMAVSLLGGGFGWQVAVFLAVSAVLLACLKPFIQKFITPGKTATNTEALFGKEAIVTETVDALRGTGTLKLEGKEWSVRSVGGEVIKAGTLVRILNVEGVKLCVEPVRAEATV